MSKTHNKYSKSFTNGYDDTHHTSQKFKDLKQKKNEKHLDNAFRAKDLPKILVLEEQH